MNSCLLLYFTAVARFSFGWQVPGPLSACDFFSTMKQFYSYAIPHEAIQVHTCVAALHGFDTGYLLKLPDGSNCSGIWGLSSASLDACKDNTSAYMPPFSWGCFYVALSNDDPISVIRYNACQELRDLANNETSLNDSLMPTLKPPFAWPSFQDSSINFWETLVCMGAHQRDVLYLPSDSARIVVAAQTYEQVLRQIRAKSTNF